MKILQKNGFKGFSLVELLVAILILSLGVLGAAAMQARAMQVNRDSKQQSSAVRYALELAEMMRGNKDVAIQTNAAQNPYLVSFANSSSLTASCAITTCASTTQAAQRDVADWAQRLTQELPGSRVTVCFDQTPYTAAGLPQWACDAPVGTKTIAIKIGWTRLTTDSGAVDTAGAATGGIDQAERPSVVLTVIPGSPT